MKRTFLKASVMLLVASMTLTSCQDFWDDLFGTEDAPTENTTPEESGPKQENDLIKTENGAEATVKSFAEITDLLNKVRADIEKAAKSGDKYVFKVKAENLKTTSADCTVEVPKVTSSDINLEFANKITTEIPLVVKAAERKHEEPIQAVDKLTITMPASEGLNLELDMPETAVTLKVASGLVTFDELVTITATNALYIESGVTVKNLQVKGGNVVVKDGGKAETYVYAAANNDDTLSVGNDGSIHVGYGSTVKDENDAPYPCKNLKIIKGAADYAKIKMLPNNGIEHLTIAEGVVVKTLMDENNMKVVEGEGKGAELQLEYDDRWITDENGKEFTRIYSYLWYTEMKNIVLSQVQTNIHADSLVYTAYTSGGDLENCTFRFDDISLGMSDILPNTPSIKSCKNCKFEATNKNNIIHLSIPGQCDYIPSYNFNFTNCDFTQGFKLETTVLDRFPIYDENGHFSGYADAEFADYDVTITFTNCKLGSESISNPSDFISKPDIPAGVNLKYVIDSKTYEFVDDSLVLVQ
ncbi:MAG: hypothetical protein J1E58_10215 [Prevotella sp.]|nr:hypothetical protein [Prevotella sp.]